MSGHLETSLEAIGQWVGSAPPMPVRLAALAEDCFLDTVGCIAAGIDTDLPQQLIKSLCVGTSTTSGVLFTAVRCDPATAALINATAAHAVEMDDWDQATEGHMSAVIVPALIALTDINPATGAQLVDAYLFGVEVAMCCGEALNPGHLRRGWHPTSTIGTFGAAAACCRLMGLKSESVVSALSMATTNAGLKCQIGTAAKPLHAGFAAQIGLQSALMAAQGVTASRYAFDGSGGVFDLRSDAGSPGFGKLVTQIGRSLWIDRFPIIRKLYPTCGIVHRPIEGTRSLLVDHGLTADDVRSVTIVGEKNELGICHHNDPHTVAEARFSITFGVAVTLMRGTVTLSDLDERTFGDPVYRENLRKVYVEHYDTDSAQLVSQSYPPILVMLETKDGVREEIEVRCAKGWPEMPLTQEEVQLKCQRLIERLVGAKNANAVVELLSDLRELETLECLKGSLVCPGK